MYKVVNQREEFLKNIYKEGEAIGIEKGKLEMAREIAEKYGADKISEISGIDKEH